MRSPSTPRVPKPRALTRELLLSELFGHERGAFTGAIERRTGLLAAAEGGTVFLDEVGELAPEAQAMLLRFLASGEVRAVGATRTRTVDVRVIAATHRDLLGETLASRFRVDLYYRLRRVVLRVPALRERRGDLPLLIEHCRQQANTRHGLAIAGLTPAARRRLAGHPWPGNVRELEAVLEEAMILKGRGWLGPDDLVLDDGPVPGVHPSGYAGREAVALRLAITQGVVTRRELAVACGVSGEVARRTLVALVVHGRLQPVGTVHDWRRGATSRSPCRQPGPGLA